MIVLKDIIQGLHFKIVAIAHEGECGTEEFIQKLLKERLKEFNSLVSLLQHLAHGGQIRNEEKCKHITGSNGLFELKPSKQARLIFFYDKGKVVVCTNGFIKKQGRIPPMELDKAHKLQKLYLDSKTNK